MSSHRRRLLWTLAHILPVSERLTRTYLKFSISMLHQTLTKGSPTGSVMPGRLDDWLSPFFWSFHVIFIASMHFPLSSNFSICVERSSSWREREEQSLLVTFLPNRDQAWTAAPCNIFIVFAQRREGGKILCLFCFVPHRGV